MTAPIGGPNAVKLVPILDLKAAAPLAEQLLALRGADLRIDGSEVERLGSQCLQVLLSAHLTWQADDHTITLEGPSEAMRTAASQLGAAHALLTMAEKVR